MNSIRNIITMRAENTWVGITCAFTGAGDKPKQGFHSGLYSDEG